MSESKPQKSDPQPRPQPSESEMKIFQMMVRYKKNFSAVLGEVTSELLDTVTVITQQISQEMIATNHMAELSAETSKRLRVEKDVTDKDNVLKSTELQVQVKMIEKLNKEITELKEKIKHSKK